MLPFVACRQGKVNPDDRRRRHSLPTPSIPPCMRANLAQSSLRMAPSTPAFAPGAALPRLHVQSRARCPLTPSAAPARTAVAPSRAPRRSAPSMRTRRKPRLQIELPENLAGSGVVRALDGSDFDFASTAGQVVLAVNIASQDPAAEEHIAVLKDLHARYGGAGLMIIAVPSNWFGQYEPGPDEEVAERLAEAGIQFLCLSKLANFDIEVMPMFELGVKAFPADILWNFEGRFLFDKKGKPVARFDLLTTSDYVGALLEQEHVASGAWLNAGVAWSLTF